MNETMIGQTVIKSRRVVNDDSTMKREYAAVAIAVDQRRFAPNANRK